MSEYDNIPQITMDALIRYRDKGIIPGGFLQAVLKNDLFGTYERADQYNKAELDAIVKFIFNRMPMSSWGSWEKMYAYSERIQEELEREEA